MTDFPSSDPLTLPNTPWRRDPFRLTEARFFGLAILLLMALGAGPVSAQEESNDEAQEGSDGEENRPLTLPQQAARPLVLDPRIFQFGLEVRSFPVSFCGASIAAGRGLCGDDPGVQFDVHMAHAIVENLDLGVRVGIQLAPEVAPIGGVFTAFRFVEGPIEVAARLDLDARDGSNDTTVLRLRPSIPFRFHLGEAMRLDLAPGLTVRVNEEDAALGAGTPLSLTTYLGDGFWMRFGTGFFVGSFDAPGDTLSVPVSAQIGVTFQTSERGAPIDLFLGFEAPYFVHTFGEVLPSTDAWSVNAGATIFLGL